MKDPESPDAKIWRLLRQSEAAVPPAPFAFDSRVMARIRARSRKSARNLAFGLSPAFLLLIMAALVVLSRDLRDLQEFFSLSNLSFNPFILFLS